MFCLRMTHSEVQVIIQSHGTFKLKKNISFKTASNPFFQDAEHSSRYIQAILCQKSLICLSYVTFCCAITCHILRKLIFFHEKRCDFFSNTASFLKLEKNPHMTSEKIAFQRDSCGVFSLSSKMKPYLKKSHTTQFCDICYFRKVGPHQIFVLYTFIKKIIGLAHFLSSS